MNHMSSTPFGCRPVTAGLIQSLRNAEAAAPVPQIDKWEVFRQLSVARHTFALTDRDLTVLNALLSFHQGKTLGNNAPLVVFPSNRALSERAHGMPESTLRRHVAALVQSGVVLRRDSPNGKRYAHKDHNGDVIRAFGFDLRPLLARAAEIAHAAEQAQAAADHLKALRTDVSLMKRDAVKFALYGQENGLPGDWDSILTELLSVHTIMRRKLKAMEIEQVADVTRALLVRASTLLSLETMEMSGRDGQYERQLQNSDKEESDFEARTENKEESELESHDTLRPMNIPFALVKKACPDLQPYCESDIGGWSQFVRTGEFVRGMMGISPSSYSEACTAMGRQTAAIAVACILQRIESIKSPGGYLRSLARKAELGQFSIGPMVMALLNDAKS